MLKNPTASSIFIFSLVFFSGFANLATEIIGPRMVASLFGSTTIIWAIIISVTLVGISVGYFLGGRVPADVIPRLMPALLILNAAWLLGISWFIWGIRGELGSVGYIKIGLVAILAFFPPAVLFSMTSPIAITLLVGTRPKEAISRLVGNVYAVGTLGSVLGALAAAFLLIPWVGLSVSLKIFAIIEVIYAIVFLSPRLRVLGAILLIPVILFPNPSYQLEGDFSSILLEQREGYYQTIRVYTDNLSYVRMDLGPTLQTKMSLDDKEPLYAYARQMVELAGDVQGKKILIIGGAGHTQARALEKRGASVTEIEIDPFIIQMSDRYFGEIAGPVHAVDGRAYLEGLQDQKFDLILVDAFDGLGIIPTQLTTREFFQSVERALTPTGRMIFNFIGIVDGPKSNSYRALSTTMASVFSDTRVSEGLGEELVNVIMMASPTRMEGVDFQPARTDGAILTDDLNPIEMYFVQVMQDYYAFR